VAEGASDPPPAGTSPPSGSRFRRFLRGTVPVGLSALMLAGLTVAVVRVTAQPGKPRDLLDLLSPTAPGTTWVYETTNFGKPAGQHVVQVVGTGLLNGTGPALIASSHYDDFVGNGPLDSLVYSGRRGDRLLAFGSRRLGSFDKRDPPTPTLVAPLRTGQRWTWKGTSGTLSERITATVVGFETVRVAGRSLTGCLHVSSEIVDEGTPPETSEEWDCPGYGKVRSRQEAPAEGSFPGALLEEELVEFHGPGRDLMPPDGTASAAAGDQPPGGGPGVDPGRSGYVAGAKLDPGRLAWSDGRLGHLHFPPVGADGVSVTAEEDGTTSALDTRTGEVLWSVRVPGPVTVSPVVAGSTVLVAAADKSFAALDVQTGLARWIVAFEDLAAAPPLPAGDRVVLATEDRAVHALRLADGAELWSRRTGDLVRTPPALAGGTVILGDQGGSVLALSLRDGSTTWQASLDGALTAGPTISGELAVVADAAETVTGLDAASGAVRWRTYPDSSVVVTPAVAPGHVVFVAADTERLVSVAPADGQVQWRARLNAAVEVPPLILGDEILVLTAGGLLRSFSVGRGEERPPIQVHGPTTTSGFAADIPMNWMDGALVVAVDADSPWPVYGYIQAFPAPTGAEQPGPASLRLQGEVQVLPGIATLTAQPAVVDDGLVVAVKDNERSLQAVYRVGRTQAAELLQSDQLIPFTVLDGDRILTQQGEDLVSVPVAGGPPAWRFHIGSPTVGSVPVVVDGVVVVPVMGEGLSGLDAGSGRALWSVASPGLGASGPLVLPGGDVVYGVGRLVRLDPHTGAERWSLPGVSTFAPLAYGDGAIVLLGFLQDQAFLLSVEAESGAFRWVSQDLRVGVSGGPATAPGLAVVVDSTGSVAAFDARTGARTWSVRLRTAPVGAPVVVDGRVAILESGRTEDLQADDYRLTILDAATGRFLASYRPGGTGFALVGSFAAPGGRFLLPAPGLGRGTLQVMEATGP
jgi:outer membrane protein assembly factor BamB